MRVCAYSRPDTVLQLVNSEEGAFKTEIVLSCQTSRRYWTISWQKTRILYPRICPYELHRDGVARKICCVFDVHQDISKFIETSPISNDRRLHRVNA